MSVKTLNELKADIIKFIGENDSDEAIALVEDVTDTFSDFDTRSKGDTDWKTKFEENDKEWRRKYRERFTKVEDTENEEDVDEDDEHLTYEKLFKEDK